VSDDIRMVAGELNRRAGEIKAYFEMWEKNHLEYKGDIADCMDRFNKIDSQLIRTREYLERIADAQTESAIRASRFEQTIVAISGDVLEHSSLIKGLDERVTKIETQHAKENGRNQVAFALWSILIGATGATAGAVLAVVAPWAFSHWMKG
jgi:DNA repair exonuclease SbcCD ATPase subunit